MAVAVLVFGIAAEIVSLRACLQEVNKLRRGESFVLTTPSDASGHRALWISPAIPLTFHLFGLRAPKIDPALIDELMRTASGPDGLDLREFVRAAPAAVVVPT